MTTQQSTICRSQANPAPSAPDAPVEHPALVRRSLDAMNGAGTMAGHQPVPLRQDSPCSWQTSVLSMLCSALVLAILGLSVPVIWWRLTARTGPLVNGVNAFDLVAACWVVGAGLIGWSVARATAPPRRGLAPTPVWYLWSRIIELSFFGAGSKRRWTTCQSSQPLRWLTGVVPHRSPAVARRPGVTGDQPADRPADRPASGVGSPVGPEELGATIEEMGGTGVDGTVSSTRAEAEAGGVNEIDNRPANHAVTPRAPLPPTPPIRPRRPAATPTVRHDVVRGDTWWSLAQAHLGDGSRWEELQQLNDGHEVAPGVRCTPALDLRTGWTVRLPVADRNRQPEPAVSPRRGRNQS